MSTPGPSQPVAEPSTVTLMQEQTKQIEINRLRAKAKQREIEQQTPSTSLNANKKRPISVTDAASKDPTATGKPKKLRRDTRLMGTYIEYDLSKMVNTHGGFLVEDGKEVDAELLRKEKEREKERATKNMDPPMFLDPKMNPKCSGCPSLDLDQSYKKVFGCLVCNKCRNDKPEKYSLLTKTECKEDYLLTDPELRDEDLLPHMLKANPHQSTYANMMLFLRFQVEEFAWKKWGSAAELDVEYEKRTAAKSKQKNKKFEKGLKELRRKTREGVWQRRKDDEHKHVFGKVEVIDGVSQEICHTCGFSVEIEEL